MSSTKIKLVYRAFVREHRATLMQFEDVIVKLKQLKTISAEAFDPSNIFVESIQLRMKDEDRQWCRDNGIVTVAPESGEVIALLRQSTVTVPNMYVDELLPASQVNEILEKLPNTFTNVEVIQTYWTDVPPH